MPLWPIPPLGTLPSPETSPGSLFPGLRNQRNLEKEETASAEKMEVCDESTGMHDRRSHSKMFLASPNARKASRSRHHIKEEFPSMDSDHVNDSASLRTITETSNDWFD